jgi:hypothetical protein
MKMKYRSKKWLDQMSNKVHFKDDPDNPGGGGGGGGDDDPPETFTKDQLSDAVAKAVQEANDKSEASNKTKRDELLAETKAAKEAAKKWDGLDFDAVNSMMKAFGENEEAQLIADGKFEEVLDKRMDRAKAEWEGEKSTFSEQLLEINQERDLYKGLYENKLADIQIRAAAEKANVIPTAIEDIVARGLQIFKVDSEGNLEARNKNGDLIKTESDLLLTTELFLESLKDTAPHYWPAGEGTGGQGSKGGKSGEGGQGTIEERKAAAASRGDMKEFNRLRDIQKKERREAAGR